MRNPGGFGDLGFERAVLDIEIALRKSLETPWRRLEQHELTASYARRRFVRGWRIDMRFDDGATRSIDLLVGPGFPAGYPRTALVDGPGQLVWPHVEYDGVLCLLPIVADVDAEQPGEVAIHLLARSARLIQELLDGHIVERDFREEFLTYWAYGVDGKTVVHSLVEAKGPSREVCVWRDDRGAIFIGEDRGAIETWLSKRFGKMPGRKTRRIDRAAFLWLPEPPLPSQYPETGADLLALAQTAGDDAASLLVEIAGSLPQDVTVLIGAEGRGGPGLVAATTTAHRKDRSHHGRVEQPFLKGFSRQGMPTALAAHRTYSAARVEKRNVERADPLWIHGRGKDPRTATLLEKVAIVVGAGAVGSAIAAKLARAGVGTIHIIDFDSFGWANLGRHELGAGSIGKNKALELAERLQADFPHLTIRGHDQSVHALIGGYEGLLETSDLIVSATASWDAEGALNRWHVGSGRTVPVLYAWTERLAASGHAVVIGRQGGCLRCGFGATGKPKFTAVDWGEAGPTVEEPACGNHFTPYGAVELGFANDLIATRALAALLDPPEHSSHYLWLGSTEAISQAGGQWSEALSSEFPDQLDGQRCLERQWPSSECPACHAGEAAAEAA